MTPKFWMLALPFVLVLSACDETDGGDTAQTNVSSLRVSEAPKNANKSIQNWPGKWLGPEGTFMLLEPNGEEYRVTIQDLDGPRIFNGEQDGNEIKFMRDHTLERIRAGNGEETGMKWLMDKKDCLIVKQGEGYCRS